MMNRKVSATIVCAFLAISIYVYRDVDYLRVLGLKKDIFQYKKYEEPMECYPETYTAKKVEDEAKQVQNQHLKYWVVYLMSAVRQNENITAYLVTSKEDPFTMGTTVLLATNCKTISNFKTDILPSFKAKKEEGSGKAIDTLFSVYVFHQENKQLELAKALIFNEKIYINVEKDFPNDRKEPESP